MSQALKPKQVGNLVRMTEDFDDAGVLRRVIVVYGGSGGSDIWLEENQSVIECMRSLGIICDHLPSGNRWVMEERVYEHDLARSKAEYCSHPETEAAADKFFSSTIDKIRNRIESHNRQTEPGGHLRLETGLRLGRISGSKVTCHARLEKPRDSAPRKMWFECNPYSTEIRIDRILSPRPVGFENARMVWATEDGETSPDDIAASVVACVTLAHELRLRRL